MNDLSREQQAFDDEEILKKYSHPHSPPELGTPEYEAFTAALARKRVSHADPEVKVITASTRITIPENKDAGIKSRDLLEEKARRMRKRRDRIFFWSGWVCFLFLLCGLGGAGYYYAINNMTSNRFTVPFTCKIQLGDVELEGRRHLSFPVKELDGWQWTPPWAAVHEDVEFVLNGSPLSIMGISDKGKIWRKDYQKGDLGVAKVPRSPMYWLVGKNVKETAAVAHATFCK